MRVLKSSKLVMGVITAALAVGPAVVLATTAPTASAAVRDQGVSGSTSPMWQTNNNVEAIAVSNGVVYAGGTFTSVRPPGAAAGTSETPRTYLAAFDASTGALVTAFNVTLNGRVDDIVIAPGGTRMFIVGNFTTVNGTARNRVAAINIPSGTLDTAFTANANATVVTADINANSGALYVGGDFTTIRNTSKSRIASLNPTTGALNAGFTAGVEARTNVVEVAPDGSRLLVGGNFTTVNGTTTGGMASVDPSTGALAQWDANTVQPINTNCVGRVTDIVSSGDTAYVTGEGDPPGCYEGTYSARISDGHLNWNSTCLGASQGITLLNNVLYKASHQHDCAFNAGDARGGFVGGTARDDFIFQRLVGQDVSDGSFVHWSPSTNATTGSNPIGPHVIETDGSQIFVGGDFSKVNTVAQQGIARFGQGNNSAPDRPAAPTVQSNSVGRTTVIWPSVNDRDSGTLTYRLYRGNTIISTTTSESYPWSLPMMRYDDSGLTPGASYSYRLVVTDGTLTSASSTSTSVTVRSAAPSSFASTVATLGGNLFWRSNDTGTNVPDASGTGNDGQTVGGVSTTTTGALGANDTALSLDGTGYLTSNQALNLSTSFTQSVWFKTTSTTGGSLLAVTDAQTGVGTLSDRAVTMDNNGNLVFSVHQPPRAGSPDPLGPRLNNVRLQGPIYNDGRWHQVVAAWDGGTASLYVDGTLSGTYVGTAGGLTQAYQRVGYTDLTNEQAVFGRNFYNQKWPTTEHFTGSVDEVATFPSALTAAQVSDLWASGVNESDTAVTATPPTASFTSSVSGSTVGLDAGASGDADGSITGYAWSFGDQSTGSGATTSHTYATPGTYTVTLTVTDDTGLTATSSKDVTIEAPPAPVDSTVVASGSQWRYKYSAGAPPANWNTAAFDSSVWSLGTAVLGFGTSPAPTTNIDTSGGVTANRALTGYFTRTFQVPSAAKAVQLSLSSVADDGVVIYVNGTEVTRSNMPAGTVTTTTYASSARNTTAANAAPVTVNVPVNLLVDGTNVVSAETHLNYRATKDMSFDLSAVLSATP